MRLISIASRNLRQRLLTSSLTVVSIMLGAALVAFLWLVANQAQKKYRTSRHGFNVIIGPEESSALDLVLSTIYMIKPAQGVIPLSVYREFYVPPRGEGRNRTWGRFVRMAVPLAFGDSYRGFPIIATTEDWFLRFGNPADSVKQHRPPKLVFAKGRSFRFSHADLIQEAELQKHLAKDEDHKGHDHGEVDVVPDGWREVVVGASAAARLGLGLGSEIVPAHGTGKTLHHHDEAKSKVVGILAPTGTPIDRGVFIPLGAHWRLKGHAAIGSTVGGHGDVEISALVVNTRPGAGTFQIRRAFQRRKDGIAALPDVEIPLLFAVVGDITRALRAISWVVLLVAALAVFIALYNTMNERRRDVAIMRSLGARRTQIFGVVLFEALLITGTGALLGVLVAHAATTGLGPWLAQKTGVSMTGVAFGIEELWLILGVTLLGAVAGVLPAVQASRTDVAQFLTPDR